METAAKVTRTFVVHPNLTSGNAARDPVSALKEAVSLAGALPGVEVVGDLVVPLSKPRPGTLFGPGKCDELGDVFEQSEVDLVLVDGPLSPVQQRNLEKAWSVKILDRTALILEIFSDRARTREGVLQVEMAALSYQRTRLVRAWTHLERQRGGLGFVGGPGETQIEADRRAIDDQIAKIKRQLAKVVKTRSLHRAARAEVPYPVVALVGYTNAGKSTLFNRVTGAEVMAKDMLFATLDPTMRALTLPGNVDVILSDTVGFISDLPTELVAAFRATLEEVLSADVILHVRDISHPETEHQAQNVTDILGSLGVTPQTPQVEVWNKIDQLLGMDRESTLARADRNEPVFPVSALTGEGVDVLLQDVGQRLSVQTHEMELHLPFDAGRARAWLYDQGVVQTEVQDETGYGLKVRWSDRQAKQFEAL
ncbi:MAG: GTPase HflX [Pseudomonadota bacterium]